MATKKKSAARPAKSKAKAKPAAKAAAPRKAKAAHGEGVVYTSVLRELMASRLARG